jgi:hypothetical protein
VAEQVLLVQRLFDQQQVERVQPGQVPRIRDCVRRIRVDLQQHLVAEPLAHCGNRLHIPPGLDLQLDPHVALVEIPVHGVDQTIDRVHDPDRHATRHPVTHAPSSRARGRPSALNSASSTPISSAAFAIRWPWNFASVGATAEASSRSSEATAGTRKRRSTSAAASTYSDE